jgi:hypothetical protein
MCRHFEVSIQLQYFKRTETEFRTAKLILLLRVLVGISQAKGGPRKTN